MNDPHGITYRDGQYHSFFQYVPGQTVWGPNCHWGHATGPDLLSLTEQPVAIAPGEGDDGIWTGSLVTDDNGRTVIFYTSTSTPDFSIGRVRQATPDNDDWISWKKGPFVADAPPELDIIAYRDPFVRREGDLWRMFLGAALGDGTATALSYTSTDLDQWSYEGIVLQRSTAETEPVWMGALWECPQILEIDGTGVMVSSVWDADVLHYAGYALGRYADGKFDADTWGRLTYGTSYYAPSLFTDSQGRPGLVLWMREIGGSSEGWASAHSIPFLLLMQDGHLFATPHPDINARHGERCADGRVQGLAADVIWRTDQGELVVRSGGAPVTALHRNADRLTVKIGESATTLPAGDEIRVILDGPVLEVSTGVALFGARIDPAGDALHIEAGEGSTEVYPLA